MLLVAAVCVAAGTWQIARLQGKAHANTELRHNAHAAAVPVAALLPIAGQAKAPASHKIQFRTITATGSYEATHTALVRNRTVNSDNGFLVLTPLRTDAGTLLVVRGFVSSASPVQVSTLPPPPTGTVTIKARLQPADTRNDQAAHLSGGQIEYINPKEQSARLGEPVFAGYAELTDGQPGTEKLVAMPGPDLSNPAGGAIEPQHLAYIIQWYLFALLALAAPLAMVRAETRERMAHHDDREIDEQPPAAPPTPEEARAAKLADRYGRAIR